MATPEEIINKQTWEILQDIKEESLAPEEDGTLFYDTTKTVIVAGENSPTIERKWAIVRKLAREKTIEIVREVLPDWRGERNGFYLKLLQPEFDEVYEKYKKACDLTSHLNDFQEKILKGDDKLPELYHLEDKEQTKQASPIKHKGRMFERSSGGGYYNRSHPIRPMKKQSASEIVDEFSPENYPFVLMVLKKIASLTEFSTDNEAYYKLQSPFGQAIIQERSLLKKFEVRGLFKHLGEDGVFGIATLSNVDTEKIKQIITEINKRQPNLQTKSEGKSADLKVRYKQLINEIKGQGESLLIPNQTDTQVETDFTDTASRRGYEKKWDVLQAIWGVYESHSRPDSILVPVARLTIKGRDVQLIDGIVEGLKKEGLFQGWDRKDRWYNLEFINHEMLPKVYQEVGNTYKKFAVAHEQKNGSGVTETQEQTKPTLPSDWELIEKDNTLQIIKDGTAVFTFPNNWSSKYKYFKCLWNNYGVKITYKEIYEFESNKLKYPDKHITSTNRNIRSTINKLRKEFKEINLSINIKTNKGFTLTIS